MKFPPAGLPALVLVLVLVAAGCGGGAAEPASDVGITPRSGPVQSPEGGPQPSATPATPLAAVPTVFLPAVKSLEHLSADVVVPPLPASFAPPRDDAALAALVRSTLAGFEGEYSVVVRNLEDGRSASLNAGRVYYAASLFKLALLLEAYRQRDAGELDFSELLTLEKKYADYDLGTLDLLGLAEGDMLTVADALKAMIIVSDTPSAVMIQDLVNPARVNQTLRSLGINDMSVTTYDLPTTAHDMALLMAAVAAGEGVSAESRREMLALLLQESIRDGIPSGVPPNSAVAHKSGNFTDATHDVALVWGPGGPYVLAVLSDRSWDSRPIAAVSRAVWDYFAAHP
ncbi:MAG: serine hydrolase [Dehalococcoidia bacterium]|nr:serine hydrolase [Dehalococcoidia bacterium]